MLPCGVHLALKIFMEKIGLRVCKFSEAHAKSILASRWIRLAWMFYASSLEGRMKVAKGIETPCS